MNNGDKEFRRGDIYVMLRGDAESPMTRAHRPVLIVSSDKGNQSNCPWVMIVDVTSKEGWGVICPEISVGGRRSWVKCNLVGSVFKDSLGDYICSLTESEMAMVDRGLKVTLSLNGVDSDEEDSKDEEIRSLQEEIESLKSQLARQKDSETKDTVSKDMWKRLYEKALDELVSARIALDLSERVNKPEPQVEKAVEPKVVAPKIVEPEPQVEINSCTEEDLQRIGCNATIARYIVTNRPYKSVEDLKRIPQMTRFAYQILEPKICCVPIVAPKKEVEKVERKVAKVNINTATVDEMFEGAGIPKTTGLYIRAYRNKHGAFKKVEDLLNVSKFGTGCLKKYGDLLEV